jgi:hypothetical protein
MARSLLPLAALIVLLTTGCVGPSRESMLDSMVGRDIDHAVEAFGQPAEIIDMGDGRQTYVWRRVYNFDVNRPALWSVSTSSSRVGSTVARP